MLKSTSFGTTSINRTRPTVVSCRSLTRMAPFTGRSGMRTLILAWSATTPWSYATRTSSGAANTLPSPFAKARSRVM